MTGYRILRSKRRTMSILIRPNGEVVVQAPLGMSADRISRFVEPKQEWIEQKSAERKRDYDRFTPYLTYQKVLLFGQENQVVTSKGKAVFVQDKVVYVPGKNTSSQLKKYLLDMAKEYLQSQLDKIASALQFEYKTMSVKTYRTKWGTCDDKRNITFSFRLIMLSEELIDYVIVHELCHLKELNHSKRFWNLVEQIVPNYRAYRLALKKYGLLGSTF